MASVVVKDGDPDFGFAGLHVGPREKAWLELPQLRGGIAVEGYFAGHDESGYLNAKNNMPLVLSPNPSAAESERFIDNERQLVARHVLCGWRGVRDVKSGQDVPYSEGMGLAFLRQLPIDVFGKILRFFTARENFVLAREREAAARALSGNSPAGSSTT